MFVPVVAGLYTDRVTERAALAGSIGGMVAGVTLDPWVRSFLPPPGLLGAGFGGAFVAAFAVAAVPVATSAGTGGRHVRLDTVADRVEAHSADDEEGGAPCATSRRRCSRHSSGARSGRSCWCSRTCSTRWSGPAASG